MTPKEAMKLVDAVFYHPAFDRPQDGFDTVRDKLYRLELSSEKAHRKGAWACSIPGLSAAQAARLFTVRHIAEGLDKPDRWTVDDVISVCLECLWAQAYAKKYRETFSEAFGDRLGAVLALDYAELMA